MSLNMESLRHIQPSSCSSTEGNIFVFTVCNIPTQISSPTHPVRIHYTPDFTWPSQRKLCFFVSLPSFPNTMLTFHTAREGKLLMLVEKIGNSKIREHLFFISDSRPCRCTRRSETLYFPCTCFLDILVLCWFLLEGRFSGSRTRQYSLWWHV